MSGRLLLDELVFRFRGLRISISAEPASSPAVGSPASSPTGSFTLVESSDTGAQASTGPLAEEAASLPTGPEDVSPDEAFTEVDTPEELVCLRLGPYLSLSRGLSTAGLWSPVARIARAYRAGVFAGARLRDERDYIRASPPLPLRNRLYIVLRCAVYPQGFYTDRFSTFEAYVWRNRRGQLEPHCICHGFPSRSEVEAYLAGAQVGWPQEL